MAADDVISLSELLKQKGLDKSSVSASSEEEPLKMEGQKSTNVLSMSTLKRLQAVDIDPSTVMSEDVRDNIRLFVGLDDAKVATLKARGEIGVWENVSRKKGSVLGDIATFFAGSSPQGQEDYRHAINGTHNPNPPMDIFNSPTLMLIRVESAVTRMQDEMDVQRKTPGLTTSRYSEDPEQKARDENIVIEYLTDLEEERIRGTSIAGSIAAGVLQLPEFILSFIATGGLASLAKEGAKKGVKFGVQKSIELGIKTGISNRKIATGLALAEATGVKTAVKVGTELVAGALARTAALPQFTAKNFAQRTLGSNFELTSKGYVMLNQANEGAATSMMKALGDTFIEMFSEELGGAIINPALKAVVPKGLRKSMEKIFKRYHPGTGVSKLWTKAGYDGFIAEIGEEQVGDLLRAITGVEDFGADDPGAMLDRIGASIFGFEELAINAGVLAFPGAANMGTNAMLASFKNSQDTGGLRKRTAKETREITDARVDQIIRDQELRKQKEAEQKASLKEEVLGEQPEGAPAAAKPKAPVKEEPTKATVKKTEKLSPERKLIVEGRKKQLNQEADALIKKAEALTAKRGAAVGSNLGTKGIDAQLEKIDAKLDTIDAELGELINVPGSVKITKPTAKIITTPAEVLKAIEVKAKQGVKFTQAEVKSVQRELNDIVSKFDLSKNDRDTLRKRIPNIQTAEQLEKALPAFQEAARKFEQKSESRRLRSSIFRKLRTTKPKGKKKPVNKNLVADIQKDLQVFRDIVGTKNKKGVSAIQRNNMLRDNFEALATGNMSPEAAEAMKFQNAILVMGGDIANRSVEELRSLNAQIEDLVNTGREAAKKKAAARKNRNDNLIARAIKVVEGSKPVDLSKSQKAGNWKRFKETMANGTRSFDSYEDVLDDISRDDKTSKPFESNLNQDLRVTHIEQKEKGDVARSSQELVLAGMDAFGFKNEKQFFRQINRDMKENIDLGTFIDLKGTEVKLDSVSKAQIRKMKMELMDPVLRQSLIVAEGGYQFDRGVVFHGVTEQLEAAIDNALTEEDVAFIAGQLKIYRERYDQLNKQYREDFGVDLPFNEFYSPIRRSVDAEQQNDLFLKEFVYRMNVNPSAILSRTANVELVKVQPDIAVFQRHLLETEHYLNWSDKIKDLNAVFNNRQFKNVLANKYGDGPLHSLKGFAEKYASQGSERAKSLDGMWNVIRRNANISILALKPALAIKQMTSFPAFAEDIKASEFMAGFAAFGANPKATIDALMSTDFMKTRGGSITRDIRDNVNSKAFSALGHRPTLEKVMMLSVRVGDQGAILLGGGALYNAVLKKTGSKQKALDAFVVKATQTQQSGDLSQLSEWQDGNSFQKLFTMFQTSQIQYLRREKAAIRNMLSGRISVADAAKRVSIYHIILPSLFQWAANFGRWDSEEQIRAALLGPLNGIFIIGDLMDGLIKSSLNSFLDFDLTIFDQGTGSSPAFKMFKDMMHFMKGANFSNMDMEDWLEALKELSEDIGGPATGIPVKRIFDAWEGIRDIIADDTAKGSLKLSGWSPYVVNKQLGRNKKSSRALQIP